ncbi:COG1361 family protein [Haloferax gibbonsii]|nr:hypothetical protein [Haloferax gibbonsii]
MNRREYITAFGTTMIGLTTASGPVAADTANGSLELVSSPNQDEYSDGEEVSVTVEVTNDGGSSNTMYVGYSVVDPSGAMLDNGKTTDKDTDYLSPGETQEVEVTWEVTSEASPGNYGYLVKLWDDRQNNGAPDEGLYNELDAIDHSDDNVFEVV